MVDTNSLSDLLPEICKKSSIKFDGHDHGISPDRSRHGLPAAAIGAGVVTQSYFAILAAFGTNLAQLAQIWHSKNHLLR
jgi:hypothetical protein